MAHDDNEKPHLHADDILLTCLLMMAPDTVKRLAVTLLKGHVSIKAGEFAELLIKEVDRFPSIIDFLDGCEGEKICPALVGPKAESIDQIVEKLLADIKSGSILAIALDLRNPPEPPPVEDPHMTEGAFIRAVPNCKCSHCMKVRDLEEKGLRLLKNGRTMPVDRIN